MISSSGRHHWRLANPATLPKFSPAFLRTGSTSGRLWQMMITLGFPEPITASKSLQITVLLLLRRSYSNLSILPLLTFIRHIWSMSWLPT